MRTMTITILLLIAALPGCGTHPQIASSNLQLLQSLATATGAKNADWLTAHRLKADALVAQNQMSADERAAFEPIYSAGAAGDWSAAQDRTRRLMEAQRLDRITDRTPKKPPHREPPISTVI